MSCCLSRFLGYSELTCWGASSGFWCPGWHLGYPWTVRGGGLHRSASSATSWVGLASKPRPFSGYCWSRSPGWTATWSGSRLLQDYASVYLRDKNAPFSTCFFVKSCDVWYPWLLNGITPQEIQRWWFPSLFDVDLEFLKSRLWTVLSGKLVVSLISFGQKAWNFLRVGVQMLLNCYTGGEEEWNDLTLWLTRVIYSLQEQRH